MLGLHGISNLQNPIALDFHLSSAAAFLLITKYQERVYQKVARDV